MNVPTGVIGTIQPKEISVKPDYVSIKHGFRSGIITGTMAGVGLIEVVDLTSAKKPTTLQLTSVEGDTSQHSVLANAAQISDPHPLIFRVKDELELGMSMQYSVATMRKIASLFIVFDNEAISNSSLSKIKRIFGGIFRSHCLANYPDFKVSIDAYKDFGAVKIM